MIIKMMQRKMKPLKNKKEASPRVFILKMEIKQRLTFTLQKQMRIIK